MSSDQFTEFLEQLKKEAKPGEVAMAVMRFAGDSTICHGFGAPITPFANNKEVVGTVKTGISRTSRKIGGFDFMSATASIFNKAYVEDERNNEWVDFANADMDFVFAEAPLAYSPAAELNIVRIDSKDALALDRFNRGLKFSDKLFNTDKEDEVSHLPLSRLYRREATDLEFKLMREKPEITVYLGSKAILDYLVFEKEPFKLAKLFDALSIPLTGKLQEKAQTKALEEVKEFHKAYVSVFFQDNDYKERRAYLMKALKSNGGDGYVREDGIFKLTLDSEDDVNNHLYDQHSALIKAQKSLFEKTAQLLQINVTRFVGNELEVMPHVKINLKEMLMDVSTLAEAAKNKGKKVPVT
jgi:hypothetical protein